MEISSHSTDSWHPSKLHKIHLAMPGLGSALTRLHLIGPSGVRALPLTADINVGGHYFGPSEVRALPLAAGINVV